MDKGIKDFLSEGSKIIDGPVNPTGNDERFIDIEPKLSFSPMIRYGKKKIKGGCIVEVLRIAKNKWAYLYKVMNIIYPSKCIKLDINIGDIYSEQVFYTTFNDIEKAKKEFDISLRDWNELKFYPLSDIELAKNWFNELSKEEQGYCKLLNK